MSDRLSSNATRVVVPGSPWQQEVWALGKCRACGCAVHWTACPAEVCASSDYLCWCSNGVGAGDGGCPNNVRPEHCGDQEQPAWVAFAEDRAREAAAKAVVPFAERRFCLLLARLGAESQVVAGNAMPYGRWHPVYSGPRGTPLDELAVGAEGAYVGPGGCRYSVTRLS